MSNTLDALHLLIISSGRDLPNRAREAYPGLRTTIICRTDVLPWLRSPEKIDRLIVLRSDAPMSEWLAAARFVNSVEPVDRLTNFSEKDADKAALIAVDLGLAWHRPETVRAVDDKCEMRRILAEADVDRLGAVIVTSADEVREAAESLGYPLICKPVRGIGSLGVTRINAEGDIEKALEWAAGATAELDSNELLVEPFVIGREFSVECISEDGDHQVIGITGKISEREHFIEVGHVAPAALVTCEQQQIVTTVTRMLESLGIRNGITHTEVILASDGVHVVETHLRAPGDEIPTLWAQVCGVDMLDVIAKQAVGRKVLPEVRAALDSPSHGDDAAAIWYACPDAVGEVVKVTGVAAARGSAGVFDVTVLHRPGERLVGTHDSLSRGAFVCAVGATGDEALSRAREGVRQLSFIVRADGLSTLYHSLTEISVIP